MQTPLQLVASRLHLKLFSDRLSKKGTYICQGPNYRDKFRHQQNGKKISGFPLVSIRFQISRNPETPETQKPTTL